MPENADVAASDAELRRTLSRQTFEPKVTHTLVERGLIPKDRADEIIAEAERTGVVPFYLLLKRHLVDTAEIYAALNSQSTDFQKRVRIIVNAAEDLPAWSVILNDAGGELGGAQRNRGLIVLGVAEEVAKAKQMHAPIPCFVLYTAEGKASPDYITTVAKALNKQYQVRAQITLGSQSVADVVWSQWDSRSGGNTRALTGGNQSDMQALFDQIAQAAYGLNASDIHLVSRGGVGRVMFRIDGDTLRQAYDLTGTDVIRMCSAIYDTMTDKSSVKEAFSVTEQQDGSVDRYYEGFRLRFRYAGRPVEPDGYRVAMRIIPIATNTKPKTLAKLGYSADQQDHIDAAFSRSSGLILFAGTTGSGKSTTLAHRIQALCEARPTKVVLTLEEPVEYIIPGAYQSAVKRKQGEDGQNAFQRALRSIVRGDPDVLMVGEIRDLETADLALQGVRSGHLLISTLHAPAAPSCIDRLAGMRVRREDLATVDLIAALVFQALVQTLCEHCKIPARELLGTHDETVQGTLRRLRLALDAGQILGASQEGDGLDGIFFRNEGGCDACDHRGITGRTVCAEVLQPTREMLMPIARGDSTAVWDAWRAQIDPAHPENMTGRRAIEHAMWKMTREGTVSPVEVEHQFRNLDEPVV